MTAPLTRHPYLLGPAGRLVEIPCPAGGYQPEPDLGVTVQKTLSGVVRTSRPPRSPRRYTVPLGILTDTEKSWLEACALGYVLGPLYWVDPLVVNQLPPWLSVPSSPLRDLVSTNGTLAFSAIGSQGFGGISWSPSTAVAALQTGARLPVPPGVTLTGSAYVTRTSSTTTNATAYLDFFNAAGTQLTSAVGSAVALTALGTEYRITASTVSPPAGAVTMRLAVVLSAGRTCVVDGLQVEYGPLSAFGPGPGLAKVSVLSYQPDVYFAGRTNVAMVLQEVG